VLNEVKEIAMNIVESAGYLGVFIAMVVESCLIPLPSEVTMPLAGALSAQGQMNVWVASFIGATGNVIGSLMAYGIGYKVPEKAILGFIRRWGKWILLSEHEYEKSKSWLYKYGAWVSFFSRLFPGVRTVISLPSGVARIKLIPFAVWTFLGAFLWCVVLTWAGYLLGENWVSLEKYFKEFEIAIVVILVVLVGLYVWKHISRRK
jgi:membrane protein DedA with SNARE-associated domain